MYNKIRIFPLFFTVCLCGVFAFAGCKRKEDLTMKMNQPHNIHGVSNFGRTFGDRNDRQLAIAQTIGIAPIASREAAEKMTDKLTFIDDNERYSIDSLTHSIPYLIPGAATLLDTIGQNFLDSLACKGLNPNRIRVTSVLRTQNDVKRLRRRNTNATINSTHAYGTTFDISWKRFEKVEDPDGRPLQDVGADTLKLVLAEVLRDLKQAGRCYVKYEIRQACFHITTRVK